MSVKVGGNPTRKEAEDIAGIWETGLWNNHVHADRFMLGDDTAAYLFKVRINLLSILKGHLKSFGSLTVSKLHTRSKCLNIILLLEVLTLCNY